MHLFQVSYLTHFFNVLICGRILYGGKSGVKTLQSTGKTSSSPMTVSLLFSTKGRKHDATSKASSSIRLEDSAFRKHIKSGTPYVDKTQFIVEVLESFNQGVSISRPKGFGKSLNLGMLREFLRIDRNISKSVFTADMTIMEDQHKSIRIEYMNKYPVIYFSLKSVGECKTQADAERELYFVMLRLFNEYKYLQDSEKVLPEHKDILNYVLKRNEFHKGDFYALTRLGAMLEAHHGKRSFLIIDDIDSPIAGAMVYGYLDPMRRLMYDVVVRNILCGWSLQKVIVASGMPLERLVPYRKLIDLYTYTIHDDHRYATNFGFTESDVKKLLKKSGRENDVGLMKSLTEWYSQFNIGKERMYNPYSVLKCYEANWNIKTYATASRSISKLTQHLLTNRGLLPVLNFQNLMANVSLRKKIPLHFPDFKYIMNNEDSLWPYFYHAGIVLTEVQPSFENRNSLTRVRTTDGKDIRNMLRNDVIEPLVKSGKIPDSSQLTEQVQKGNAHEVTKIIEKYIMGGGVYLLNPGEFDSRNGIIANYVELMMADWTKKHRGHATRDYPRADELILKFVGEDGRVIVRARIHASFEEVVIWTKIDCLVMDIMEATFGGPKIDITITLCDKFWREQCAET